MLSSPYVTLPHLYVQSTDGWLATLIAAVVCLLVRVHTTLIDTYVKLFRDDRREHRAAQTGEPYEDEPWYQ